MSASLTLHLTNGASIIPKIRAGGVRGPIVPWDDVLHEGPVPAGLGPAGMRERRAEFLAGCGWGAHEEILRDLAARDLALDVALGAARAAPLHPVVPLGAARAAPLHQAVRSGAAYPALSERSESKGAVPADEIVLWFEHDLYDQLHLLQILDRVPADGEPRITAVRAPTYLGQLAESAYPELFESRQFVSSTERLAARDAWTAFRSQDPRAIVDVLPRVTVLPNLGPALRRHLEQFPSMANGLSRTEQQTLEAVAAGTSAIRDVFVASNHDREEAFFMGDAAFLFHISSLLHSSRPLLRILDGAFSASSPLTLDQRVELTADGALVLSGDADRVSLCGIDRWLGGVLVAGHGPVWRWDLDRQTLRHV